jgi:hypothetical protein
MRKLYPLDVPNKEIHGFAKNNNLRGSQCCQKMVKLNKVPTDRTDKLSIEHDDFLCIHDTRQPGY